MHVIFISDQSCHFLLEPSGKAAGHVLTCILLSCEASCLVMNQALNVIFSRNNFYTREERNLMRVENKSLTSRVASVVFNLLNPIPFGLFVAVMIFDIVYANTGEVLWVKSAAWLVSLGLIFAILPRLINLCYVWFGKNRAPLAVKVDFWLNVFAVVTALVNAFVHSRDAYAAIPDALWLSFATVVAMAIGRIVLAWQNIGFKEFGHE